MESIIAELPEWAKTLFYVCLAVGGAGLFIYKRGVGAGQPTEKTTTIRTETIEGEALKLLATSIEGLSFTIKEFEDRMKEPRRRRQESAEETRAALKDTAREIGELRDELRHVRAEMSMRRN